MTRQSGDERPPAKSGAESPEMTPIAAKVLRVTGFAIGSVASL
jgi:hypothetical protein